MAKRVFDFCVASVGLLMVGPLLLLVMFLVWCHDGHSPFYVGRRIGRHGREFQMVKLRSMVVNAEQARIDSTAVNDRRITPVGRFIRRYKLDEFMQLWNVVTGDMSLIGPRPNVARDVALYTDVERRLLSLRPGITDFASIVFADEGEILKASADPDLDYNRLIRPWKSRLGLLYIDHRSMSLDLQLFFLTICAICSRRVALVGVQRLLRGMQADAEVIRVATRRGPLVPWPPPGASEVVVSRAV